MSIMNLSLEEKISFRIKPVENVPGYVKAHLASGAALNAFKGSYNFEDQIWKFKE